MSMRNKKAGRNWQKQAAGYSFQVTAARKANARYWKNCTTKGYTACIQVLFHMGLLKENEELKWAEKMEVH